MNRLSSFFNLEFLNKYSGRRFWSVLLHFSIVIQVLIFGYILPFIFSSFGKEIFFSEEENLVYLYKIISLDGDLYFVTAIFFGFFLIALFARLSILFWHYKKGHKKVYGRWIRNSGY